MSYHELIAVNLHLCVVPVSILTCLEEGGEMMMAIFALLAILQAHLLYGNTGEKYEE